MAGSDTQPAMTYPTSKQYDRWKENANQMDMSVSEWMQAMIEAGMKKFEATVEPDETVNELRQQRNDLKGELDHARDRIEKLEAQLHTSEQEKIKQTIENNPGVTIGEIGQELANTVPERLDGHLDVLQGTEVTIDGQRCYPVEETA